MTEGGFHLARSAAKAAFAEYKTARMAKRSEAEAERRAAEKIAPIIQEAMRDGAYAAAVAYAKTDEQNPKPKQETSTC